MGEVTAWGNPRKHGPLWSSESHNILCDWIFQSTFHSPVNEEGANTFNSMTENYIIETHTRKERKKRERSWMKGKEGGEDSVSFHHYERGETLSGQRKYLAPDLIQSSHWNGIGTLSKWKRKKNAGK